MPIKNYSSTVPADRSISEIQTSLVRHGASNILFEYEKGTGRIQALRFILPVRGQDRPFSLPVNWRNFQEVLKRQKVRRWDDEDYVYRVAWRCIRDWVVAQMALYETAIIDIPQIFLPFMTDISGKETLYQAIIDGKVGGLFLGSGN